MHGQKGHVTTAVWLQMWPSTDLLSRTDCVSFVVDEVNPLPNCLPGTSRDGSTITASIPSRPGHNVIPKVDIRESTASCPCSFPS